MLYRSLHRLVKKSNFCFARLLSYTSEVRETQISKHIKLREVTPKDNLKGDGQDKNPNLVLLFDWLYAKPTHLDRYCQLYHNLGLDVLTVHGKLVQFLWPPTGVKLGEDLMGYLLDTRQGNDRILVHAFSVGAYNYTICLWRALEDPDKFGKFRSLVCGQIFDSIVIGTYDNMSTGIAEALSPSTRKPVVKLMDTYYHMTKKHNEGNIRQTCQRF